MVTQFWEIAGRPEPTRMVADPQPGEVAIVEKIGRIGRRPLPRAEQLVGSVGRGRSWRWSISLSSRLAPTVSAELVLESVETTLLLKLALRMVGDRQRFMTIT